jgi:hypothetical protein
MSYHRHLYSAFTAALTATTAMLVVDRRSRPAIGGVVSDVLAPWRLHNLSRLYIDDAGLLLSKYSPSGMVLVVNLASYGPDMLATSTVCQLMFSQSCATPL